MGCCFSKSRRNRRFSDALTDGPVTVLVPSKSSPTQSEFRGPHGYAASAVTASVLDNAFTRGQAALASNYAPSHVEHTPSHVPSYNNHHDYAPPHHEMAQRELLSAQDAATHPEHAASYAPSHHDDQGFPIPTIYEDRADVPPSHHELSVAHAPSQDHGSHASSRHRRTASHAPSQQDQMTGHAPSNQPRSIPRAPSTAHDRATIRTQRQSFVPETENEPAMSQYAPSVAPRENRSRAITQTRDRHAADALHNLGHTRLHSLARPDCYPRGSRPSFRSAYARAVRRYGFDSGKHAGFGMRNNAVCKVMHTRETEHEVPAESIQNDSEYVVPVKIGTPGITLKLDFDTGSSDLWVWSSEIAHAREYGVHNIYNPKKSSTCHRTNSTWKLSYGDGSSASGDVYTDVVDVAGVRIPNQAIELAHDLSSSFLQDGGSDGLLGLAWPSINSVKPQRVATPVENMMNQRLISTPVFTVKLGHGSEPSFYSFGFIDEHACDTRIKYTDVDNSNGFWQVPSPAWSLNGRQRSRSNNTAIIDTGTTLCLVADEIVEKIYASMPGATYDGRHGGWKYPSHVKVPRVAFAVGNYLYHIHPNDFGFSDAGDGYTMGGIQSRGDSEFDILGDVWLKSVYVVFNQGEKKVGVGQRDD